MNAADTAKPHSVSREQPSLRIILDVQFPFWKSDLWIGYLMLKKQQIPSCCGYLASHLVGF
jgi:hypothetical protein